MYRDFKKLKIWEKAHSLTLDIYKLTINFPDVERYGIVSQIRRSSSSVPANIVEGYTRLSTKEYIQFLNIANASLAETQYFILLSKDLEYVNEEEYNSIEKQCKELTKMLVSTIVTLKKKING